MVTAPPLRVVFFGTPAFAVPTLDALLSSRHHVVAVVTQPDRPRGRGQRTVESPVKARAGAARVAVLQPDRVKESAFVSALRSLTLDVGVVAAYGKILTEELLAIPRLGMVNVHASLLPKYRGAAPVHRAIIGGETETGVTIMRVVKALDAGPMLASMRRPIGSDDTSVDVELDLADMGARLLVSTLDRLAEGHAIESPQDEAAATYAHRLTKEDGLLDWSQSAAAIHNRIRGLHPWPHAYSFISGRRLILLRSAMPDGVRHLPTGSDTAGTIVEAHGDRLVVATGDGILQLVEVQAEGKRPMPVRDFLSGNPLSTGDRFSSAP